MSNLMPNPRLQLLQAYPFERLRKLNANIEPNAKLRPINLSIGEPKHPTPAIIKNSVADALDGLATYPTTLGNTQLRQAIGQWITRRYQVKLDPETQVLPVLGSREALFSFAQVVLNPAETDALVISPNPFYQIYEGAALLGGAQVHYLPLQANGQCDYGGVSDGIWQRTRLVYICTPSNPTGAVLSLDQWQILFKASAKYGFVIAADECYSEIFFDENTPPLGALQAAKQLGLSNFNRLVVFSSLSKRSNAPGLRSGFVAGDANYLSLFLKYRTYHGSAMSPMIQNASIAAWNDDLHVHENRKLYLKKFNVITPILKSVYEVNKPQAGFYLWLKTPICDQIFCQELLRTQNITLLPGSFLGREIDGTNPGSGYVRIALVASLEDCQEAAERMVEFKKNLN
jgi:N-succinyldiaminopimelate aminotransferase